jgi:uncharacterized protein (DUF2062 family)
MNKFISVIYEKIFRVNDTPHKIALGFGLGIFAGILPGTGPLAALFLALIFRANRATALFSSLIINTWFSLVTFVFAIKIGSAILGLNWQKVSEDFFQAVKGFNWLASLKFSFLKVVIPVVFGYLIISLFLGAVCYLFVFLALKIYKR